MALFILSAAAFACMNLLWQSSSYQRQAGQLLAAVRLGQAALDGVRTWAYDPDNFAALGSVYADYRWPVPQHPDMRVLIQAPSAAGDRHSPNLSLEAGFGNRARVLAGLVWPVRVRIEWGPHERQSHTITSLVGRPVDEVSRLTVSGGATVLAKEEITRFQAALLTQDSTPIPAVTFDWSIVSEFATGTPGMGSIDLSMDRLGQSVAMIHHFYAGDPDLPHVPGTVRLRAIARYGGREYRGYSDPIILQ